MIWFLVRKTQKHLSRFQVEHFAFLHFEVDVLERPEDGFVFCAGLAHFAQADAVALGEVVYLDDGRHVIVEWQIYPGATGKG